MNPKRILLIDDDEDSFLITQGLLAQVKGASYDLHWASAFESGLDALRQGIHEACLLDFRLGARNGLDLLGQAIAAGVRTPIIMLTGQGDHEIDLQAMKAGAADFLDKDRLDAFRLERSIRYTMERQQLLDMINQKDKLAAIGLLAAGIAHEVNNPLSTVSNNLVVLERDTTGLLALLNAYEETRVQLALIEPKTAARIQDLAEEIDLSFVRGNLAGVLARTRENVQRVANIVNNLRNLGQIERPRFVNILFADLAEMTLGIIRPATERLRVTVAQDYEPELQIHGIAAQISQVLLNLLSNAVQAIESAGRCGDGLIRVAARQEGMDVLLEISDNGCGIATTNLPRLFDPFFTTQPVGSGTGLGLALCQAIVTGHHGRIEVETRPGHGSCFRVVLPRSRLGASVPTA